MSGLFSRLAKMATGRPRNVVRPTVAQTFEINSDLAPSAVHAGATGKLSNSLGTQTEQTNKPAGIIQRDISADKFDGGLRHSAVEMQTPTGVQSRSSQVVANTNVGPSAKLTLAIPAALVPTHQPDSQSVRQIRQAAGTAQSTPTEITGTKPIPAPDSSDKFSEARNEPAVESILDQSSTEKVPPSPAELTDQSAAESLPELRNSIASPITQQPEQLMPQVTAAAAANSAFAMQVRNQDSKTPSAQNEVHVHIGCIEVRAIAESSASNRARRPPAKIREPLSLDDYLAQRRKLR